MQWGTLFSVLIHLGLLFFTLVPAFTPPMPSSDKWVEIVEAPSLEAPSLTIPVPPQTKKSPRDTQMAETEDAKNRELDPKATILSEHNQTAQKQMRAAVTDDFRTKKGSGAKEAGPEQIAPTGDQAKSQALLGEGETPAPLEKGGVKRDWKTLSLKDLSVGAGDGGALSATDDYLPHVQQGDRTILSTREYKYFSYYQRIKELLRQHWKPRIEREIARVFSKGRTISDDELVTRLTVLLDNKGKIQKISKTSGSGFEEIDSAAVQAFEQAGPFPNPPHALVEADGYIRINWDFILKTDSGPRIQFRTAGGAAGRGPRY